MTTDQPRSPYARNLRIWTILGQLRDDVVRDIARRLQSGERYDEISAAIGIGKSTGRKKCGEIAALLGLPPERNQYEIDVEEITRRAEAGETSAEIARAMGRTPDSVNQIRRKIGLGHSRQLRISAEENAEIERRLIAGESTRTVARAVGCEQADVARRLRKVAHLIPDTLPKCQCGKAGNHGGRCLLEPSKVEHLRKRLREGAFVEQIARELGMTAPNLRNGYAKSIIAELAVEGVTCSCGQALGHNGTCSAKASRRAFSSAEQDRARELARQGASVAKIRADLGITIFSANMLTKQMRAALAAEGVRCPCGEPIDHRFSCTARNGATGGRTAFRFTCAAADNMSLDSRRKVAKLAREGWPISAIVKRTGESNWRVTQMVEELAGAGALPSKCAGCDLPRGHRAPCPLPKLCTCGRPRNHRGLCRRADGRKRVPYTKLPPEQVAEVKKRFRAQMGVSAISRVTGVPQSVVQRLVKRWRSRPGYTAKSCACGRPAFHAGGCIVKTPGAIGKRLLSRIDARVVEGETTRQIADALDLHPLTVAKHSLPARERLFAAGKTCACGRILGHNYWCSATWDLHGQPRGRRPFAQAIEREAVAALVRGDLVADIAKKAGVGTDSVYQLRATLPTASKTARARAMRDRIAQRGKAEGELIMAQIQRAVTRRIDPMLRDDVVGELYLAVMEGRLEVEQIGAAVRSFVNRGLSEWQSAYGPKSLDASLGPDDARSVVDMIRDDTGESLINEIVIGDSA